MWSLMVMVFFRAYILLSLEEFPQNPIYLLRFSIQKPVPLADNFADDTARMQEQ